MNLQEFRRVLQTTLLLHMSLLLLLALVLGWQIERTLREQQRIDHSDQITAQLNEMERLVIDEETALRGYQLTRDPATLAPYQAAEEPLHAGFGRLERLLKGDRDQQRRLRQLRDNHELWMGFAQSALARSRGAGASEGVTLDLNGKRLMDRLRAEVQSMTQIETRRRDQEVRSTDRRVRTLMTVLIASSIGVGLLLGIFTQRNLKRVSNAFRSSLDDAHQRADELFENRQWLQTTLESVGDALIACDREGRVRIMNRVAKELTGWEMDEAQGRPLDEVFRVIDGPTCEPEPAPGERTPGAVNPRALLKKDGAQYVIESTAAPIRGIHGETTGTVLVFRDVTELRQTEAALLTNEKLAVAGRLAASIAHEIHNPLDSVANLHYLIEHESDPAQQRRFMALAQQELNRTLQISRAMLSLYREPKTPVEIDLRELLESVLLLLDRRLKDQSISLEKLLLPAILVQGFPGELRQVFTNLITNAAEAAGPGGRVRIRLESIAAGGNRPVRVAITDNGAGISQQTQEKLFQPFFTTKGEHGTGLGLWVSKGIVEKHGGRLELTNSPDGDLAGAAVYVYLPAGPAPSLVAAAG